VLDGGAASGGGVAGGGVVCGGVAGGGVSGAGCWASAAALTAMMAIAELLTSRPKRAEMNMMPPQWLSWLSCPNTLSTLVDFSPEPRCFALVP
jgi:hypothetical protein